MLIRIVRIDALETTAENAFQEFRGVLKNVHAKCSGTYAWHTTTLGYAKTIFDSGKVFFPPP